MAVPSPLPSPLSSPLPGEYADLEIRILEPRDEGYPVEITFSGDQQFPRGYLDRDVVAAGRRRRADGLALFQQLFRDDELKKAWAEARGASHLRRLRLRIDDSAPELHALPWELLCDDHTGVRENLAADAETPFSRYLTGKTPPGTAVLERPIRLLLAVANPGDLDEYGLAALDVDAERKNLEDAVADIEPGQLELDFLDGPVTLDVLEAKLHEGYHVLHFVGHGRFNQPPDESILYLADRDNQTAPVTESELAEMLARLATPPRLVYLSSCQSATRSPADAFRGFAPRLVQAGVPAVVAMQDLVAIDTARELTAAFYERLLAHGLVDLAANEARSRVLSAKLPGAAVPVLYMRLRRGRLFDRRGHIVSREGESFWDSLLESIAAGECTPFLGPGVTEGLLPTSRELARELAREHGYPLGDDPRLPQVAQYVATWKKHNLLRKEVVRRLIAGFQRQIGQAVDDSGRAGLSETLAKVGFAEISSELAGREIHRQLAELDLPLYLTTNFDNLMTLALAARGRKVRRETIAWHRGEEQAAASPFNDFDPPASPEEPVVLHLFGTDEDPKSMVLTEDDYLDYLVRIARDHEYLLPTCESATLAESTLLFLGYRLDDLDLKIILRGLLPPLHPDWEDCLHVAIQLVDSPGETHTQEEVERYFQKYFERSDIDVYWGSTRQFVADLCSRWKEYRHG